MTIADRNNPYNFDTYLEKLDSLDFYRDDPFVQRVVRHFTSGSEPELHEKLLKFSQKASGRWKHMADYVARPDLRPYLEHYDAHRHRIDRIVRPAQTEILEREIFSQGLFSSDTSKWESFTKRFILDQIGEAGVLCPMACTEGLVALMEAFSDDLSPEAKEILRHCKEGINGEYGIGAQFMSEIQGGSDIPANLLEAVPEDDHYLLYGNKFFCSAMQADYSIVTAKISGTEDVGAFVVPSWLPGDKEREERNGVVINRLKWKMGTSELPTAEIDYQGAKAYPVGPTDRGVANAVGVVLTLSRLTVGRSSAANMIRAAREALLYSEFRDVFGSRICQWPMAAGQIRDLVETAQRTVAGAFKIFDLFIRLGAKLQPGLKSDEPLERQKERFNLRELIILQKLTTAYETTGHIRQAISIFGGHGVIEDFLSLPRLFRDAMVNELWEGPRNVLLMQIFRDLHRVRDWYPLSEFVSNLLHGAGKDQAEDIAARLEAYVNDPPFFQNTSQGMDRSVKWGELCDELLKAYQTQALEEVGRDYPIAPEKLETPEIWAPRIDDVVETARIRAGSGG
jgi:alkylation response protein AidB-like acyl-CoA dehydrogenase